MAYSIALNELRKYAVLSLTGPWELCELHGMHARLSKIVEEKGISAILIDARLSEVSRGLKLFDELYEFGSAIANEVKFHNTKMALVLSSSSRDLGFMTIVLKNKGIIIEQFPAIQKAEAWITGYA
jgi:hypothetical protein